MVLIEMNCKFCKEKTTYDIQPTNKETEFKCMECGKTIKRKEWDLNIY